MRSLIAFLLVVSFFSARAQKMQYDCRGCTVTKEEKHKILVVAKYETAFFDEVFGPRRLQTIRIRYYADYDKFKRAQLLTVGHFISATGLYSPGARQILIYKWEEFLRTSFHECSHAVYHQHANIRPTWIDEGLAEYFKSVRVDSLDSVSVIPYRGREQAMKKIVHDSSFSIHKTITVSYRKFHGRKEDYYYTTSWGIVNFLRRQHDDLFRTILYKVSIGVKSQQAIEEDYPGGIAQLERDLVQFYR